MGTDLFDRLPNGIRLNAAGERMLQHIRATLNDFHLMRGELDELKDERTGHVSVAAMDSLFVDLLPAAVEEFSGQYPAVTYAITAVTPWDVASKVLSGEYDVGITFISAAGRPRRDDPGRAAAWRGDGIPASAGQEGRREFCRLPQSCLPEAGGAISHARRRVAEVLRILGSADPQRDLQLHPAAQAPDRHRARHFLSRSWRSWRKSPAAKWCGVPSRSPISTP